MSNERTTKFSYAVERMKKEFDQLLEQTWGQGEKAVNQLWSRMPAGLQDVNYDVVETSELIVVLIDISGIPIDQIDLSLVGNVLSLKGKYAGLSTNPGDQVHKQSRPVGDFQFSLTLPVAVNPDQISAIAKDGVLKVSMQKAIIEREHKIPIKDSNSP